MNKKAQFGPDALVGLVLVAVLGLGGIFFLNTFVNGLAVHGLLSILDSEIDQRCFFILLPLTGDEYSRAGDDFSNRPPFDELNNYFGQSNYSLVSYEFNNTINLFRDGIKRFAFLTEISYINGYIAIESEAAKLRAQSLDELQDQGFVLTNFCSLPVYSPAGKVGSAELLLSEK